VKSRFLPQHISSGAEICSWHLNTGSKAGNKNCGTPVFNNAAHHLPPLDTQSNPKEKRFNGAKIPQLVW
jgi:hypothetical protein